MGLADNKCVPCRGGVPPLERAKAEGMLKQLDSGWVGRAEKRSASSIYQIFFSEGPLSLAILLDQPFWGVNRRRFFENERKN
jgi:hypothetical protein